VDGAGNIYVADTNSAVHKITPAGVITTLAGLSGARGHSDGLGSLARFAAPAGLAADSAGNVYVADTGNNAIRKVTPAGTVSTLAGGGFGSADGTGSAAQFNRPTGVAVDSAGNVYVADTDNHTIRKVSPGGAVSTLAGLAGFTGFRNGMGSDARFDGPTGVAVDDAGYVYVADSQNHLIRIINPDGVTGTVAGIPFPPGNEDASAEQARFNAPRGVAVDRLGNIYVADSANNTIRRISAGSGRSVTTLAGSPGDAPGNGDGRGRGARFHYPTGVAIDPAGNVYAADLKNSAIRRITPAGEVTTLGQP
jgi:streptogramin lyase